MPDSLGLTSATLGIATGHDLSLALVAGSRLLAEHHEALARGHAEALMPAIRALFGKRSPPSRIVVETGPGSFTGLRVGIAAARALGLAWQIPVLGVASTALVAAEALARGATGRIGVALAAPRGQVWFEEFEGLRAVGPAVALNNEAFHAFAAGFAGTLTGSGAVAAGLGGPETTPRAGAVRLLPADALGSPDPRYVRAQPAQAA
jgi:tRNA threonylcarbamoyl adenosine modification protein YeaZ